jgi:hypothetical protein
VATVSVLAAMNVAFGWGVRIWLWRLGKATSDFFELGRTASMSVRALRAAPYLNLWVWSTNVLVGGSLLLAIVTLGLLPFGVWFRDRRAALLVVLVLTLLVAVVCMRTPI